MMGLLEGKKIELQLFTPIELTKADPDNPERTKEEPVFRILGKVESFSEAGMVLEVSEMVGNREQRVASPRTRLFIPLHKIDHFFVVG